MSICELAQITRQWSRDRTWTIVVNVFRVMTALLPNVTHLLKYPFQISSNFVDNERESMTFHMYYPPIYHVSYFLTNPSEIHTNLAVGI